MRTAPSSRRTDLPFQVFAREREFYSRQRRRALSYIESLIAVCFVLLYLVMLVAAIVAKGT